MPRKLNSNFCIVKELSAKILQTEFRSDRSVMKF